MRGEPIIIPEKYQEKIDELEQEYKGIVSREKEIPDLKGYTFREIEYIFSSKAEPYQGLQQNLFGEVSLEKRVYEVYLNYRGKYTYKSTARRHTAKDFNNLDEQDIKRLINRYERKYQRHKNWKAKKELSGFDKEINKLEKKHKKIIEHNNKVLDKAHKIKDKQWELVQEKKKTEFKQGRDSSVIIDFRGLPDTRLNVEISGSLVFISQFFSRKELEIARKNNRIKILAGDLNSALKHCNFIEHESNEECFNCGKKIDYNIIGFNRKMGRKENWLCLDCLDYDIDFFERIKDNYKSRGCDLFV